MDTIAPEIARKLLNRDFANLAQRVQRGGNLNRLFHSMEELWQALCVELQPFYQPERVHQLLGSGPILAPANASFRQ
jgi:hypothetical protein